MMDSEWTDGQSHDVVAEGTLDFHGVQQARTVTGKLVWKEGGWASDAVMDIALNDHDIRVPAVVKDNISSVIAVDIHAQLSPR